MENFKQEIKKEFMNKFANEGFLEIKHRNKYTFVFFKGQGIADFWLSKIDLALAEERKRIVERVEKLRKIERYPFDTRIIVDEKNINFNQGIDSVINSIKEE